MHGTFSSSNSSPTNWSPKLFMARTKVSAPPGQASSLAPFRLLKLFATIRRIDGDLGEISEHLEIGKGEKSFLPTVGKDPRCATLLLWFKMPHMVSPNSPTFGSKNSTLRTVSGLLGPGWNNWEAEAAASSNLPSVPVACSFASLRTWSMSSIAMLAWYLC